MDRPRILITNDDGIHSAGIEALETALRDFGDIYVVAPASEQSGASHSLTLSRPLRIRQLDERHWTVDGTPTDCVTFAVNQILQPRRAAADLLSPASITARTWAMTHRIPEQWQARWKPRYWAFPALRLASPPRVIWILSSRPASPREITLKALAEGIPPGTLLNVNIPTGPAKGIRLTKQGFKAARPVISEHIDPRGKLYYWIGEVREGFRAEGGTDFEAIDEGYVSVSPMRSDLTDYKALEAMKGWIADRDD